MNRPKAVVFDLGKVLVDFDYGITVRRILSRCRIGAMELRQLIDQSPLLHRYETGLLSTRELYDEVQRAAGYEGGFEEFCASFADIFTPIVPMVELHAELRRRGVPLYVFSNTNELAVRHIRAQFPFFSEFDGYILSFEHRAMKPEETLYQIVERVAQGQGNELLYVDDRPENIATGTARGWHAVLHESPEQTRAAVVKLGFAL
ncbi:MAG: HAD family phosphatase [Verrucomicrobiota bacterium]